MMTTEEIFSEAEALAKLEKTRRQSIWGAAVLTVIFSFFALSGKFSEAYLTTGVALLVALFVFFVSLGSFFCLFLSFPVGKLKNLPKWHSSLYVREETSILQGIEETQKEYQILGAAYRTAKNRLLGKEHKFLLIHELNRELAKLRDGHPEYRMMCLQICDTVHGETAKFDIELDLAKEIKADYDKLSSLEKEIPVKWAELETLRENLFFLREKVYPAVHCPGALKEEPA